MAAAAAAAADAKCSAAFVSATLSSSPKLQSSPVTPSPTKGKRKREMKRFQAPSDSADVGISDTPTITMESMKRLVESRIIDGIDKDSDEIKLDTNLKIDTTTLHGWCLVDALVHCGNASNGILAPLILEHGPPGIYMDHLVEKYKTANEKKEEEDASNEYPSFRALCRTVAGQQLAGRAAVTIWRRLVGVVAGTTGDDNNSNSNSKGVPEPSLSSLQSFTPETLLAVVESLDDIEALRKPAGLSRAKCDCIVAIARSFRDGSLSEAFLTQPKNDEEIRSQLLSIKGLGPWSVDMFLMFRCHRSNLLPIGDLAVRNGTGVLWKAGGKALCAKKDAAFITECHAPFEPYRSVSSYYMYKVADSVKAKKKQKAKKGKA